MADLLNGNAFDEMSKALAEAKHIQLALDRHTAQMCLLIRGRLKGANVPDYILAELKRELRDFNAHTGRWK